MPKGRFTFIYENDETETSSEFEVTPDANMQTVIEAFAEFLKLCGFVYDSEGDQN